jgi:nicotinamidase-related amidase
MNEVLALAAARLRRTLEAQVREALPEEYRAAFGVRKIAPRPGEFVLHKTTSGPLNSTRLDRLLHNLGVTSLVVAGLTTDVCVTQTARETADRGFRVVVAGDACTTLSEEMHAAALLAFSLAFGRVRKTDEVLALLGACERATTAW